MTWLRLRLWWARIKRTGLRRERMRLHQQRAGIAWELDRNTRDAAAADARIAALTESLRRCRFDARYRWQPPFRPGPPNPPPRIP